MKRATISGAAIVAVLVVLAQKNRAVEPNVEAPAVASLAAAAPTASTEAVDRGFLYGRVTTGDGGAYVGRLRFGRDEEAFWGDYFNGVKAGNPWAAQPPIAELTEKRRGFTIFGFEIPLGEPQIDLGRPFMARFGDISRIEARGRDVRVTLKSGTVFDVNWNAANDLDDGVRVWQDGGGVIDLFSWAGGVPPASRVRIRTIEFLQTARLGAVPARLHGTVRTRHGNFTGFVQWDRQSGVATDALHGRAAEGPVSLRFDTVRSIARDSRETARVTLAGGREIVLSVMRGDGNGNRGIYVDDARYGRVLVSWEAFERIDFSAAGSGPAYADFPRGHALTGSVITRQGRRLAGRLVYDLDESEVTETLDAPSRGVDYTIPFGMLASIVPGREEDGDGRARVTLRGGEELQLDRAGDLGERHGGMLIFADGHERPEYVKWIDVAQVHFNPPPLMYPPVRRQ